MSTFNPTPQGVASSNDIAAVELPPDVYSHIWKFLIDPKNGCILKRNNCLNSKTDIETVTSLRLVNKRAKEAFEQSQCWTRIAKTLVVQAEFLVISLELKQTIPRHGRKWVQSLESKVFDELKAVVSKLETNSYSEATEMVGDLVEKKRQERPFYWTKPRVRKIRDDFLEVAHLAIKHSIQSARAAGLSKTVNSEESVSDGAGEEKRAAKRYRIDPGVGSSSPSNGNDKKYPPSGGNKKHPALDCVTDKKR